MSDEKIDLGKITPEMVTFEDAFTHIVGMAEPTEDEISKLHGSLLEEGCYDSVKVWAHDGKADVVDGVHRVKFCREHGIPFKVEAVKSLVGATLDQAEVWVINWQMNHRSPNETQKRLMRGRLLELTKRQGQRTDKLLDKADQKSSTEKVADAENISPKTASRDAKVYRDFKTIREVAPVLAAKIESEDIKLGREEVGKLAEQPPDILKQAEEKAATAKTLKNLLPPTPKTPTINDDKDVQYVKSMKKYWLDNGKSVLGFDISCSIEMPEGVVGWDGKKVTYEPACHDVAKYADDPENAVKKLKAKCAACVDVKKCIMAATPERVDMVTKTRLIPRGLVPVAGKNWWSAILSDGETLRAWVTERGDDVEFLVTIKETDGDVFRTDPKNPTAKLLHNNLIKIKPLEEEKDAIS